MSLGYCIPIFIFYRCWLVVAAGWHLSSVESGAGAGVRGLSCPAPACTNSTNRGQGSRVMWLTSSEHSTPGCVKLYWCQQIFITSVRPCSDYWDVSWWWWPVVMLPIIARLVSNYLRSLRYSHFIVTPDAALTWCHLMSPDVLWCSVMFCDVL